MDTYIVDSYIQKYIKTYILKTQIGCIFVTPI